MKRGRLKFVFLTFLYFCVATFVSASSNENHQYESFQLGIRHDLAGKPELARKLYDDLIKRNTILDGLKVASAINMYSLGNEKEAFSLFEELTTDNNQNDSEYAALWGLLSIAKRDSNGKEKKLKEYSKNHIFNTPYRAYLAEMFSGNMSPNETLVKIKEIHFPSIAMRNDAITTSVFFISSYMIHVKRDHLGAKDIIEKEKANFFHESLERPLMN